MLDLPSFLTSKAYVTNIRKPMVAAIAEYDMLQANDRVLVAVSGGKDSTILLLALEDIRRRAPFVFSLQPVIIDQKQPGFSCSRYQVWLKQFGFDLQVVEEDTYSIVTEKTKAGKSYCGLCSRLRRGILYTHAHQNRFDKIALGHHRDDLNETVLMNMFYSGSIASMPPKLKSDDGRNTVIRPMCYVAEADLLSAGEELAIPVIPCNLCGSQDGLKRQRVKRLLRQLEQEKPDIGSILLNAQKNVRPSQLADTSLHTF